MQPRRSTGCHSNRPRPPHPTGDQKAGTVGRLDEVSGISTPDHRRIWARWSFDLRGWIAVAWVAYWSWAYVRSALAHRFPIIAEWVGRWS
jgi:hypothetical protein